jgi:phospholipid/cholesterol/gamma-HCH transport system substrate-binding protein
MESRINYTLVGLFVVILSVGMISFVYWLGKYGGRQKYDYYLVHMSESVAGLSTDSSVRYRGVEVGTVDRIGLNPKNSEEVELLLKIKRGTPIKVDTVATLKSFGLTGLDFVELKGSDKDAPLLKKTGDEIPVILATPSLFAQIDDTLAMLSTELPSILDRFDQLLAEDNLRNIAAILSETKMLTDDVRGQLEGVERFVDNGVAMETGVAEASEKVAAASASVKKMAESLERDYGEAGRNVSHDLRGSLASLNRLLYETDLLVRDLRRTLQSIESSPGDLLFKRTRPRPGPGEEGYNEKK